MLRAAIVAYFVVIAGPIALSQTQTDTETASEALSRAPADVPLPVLSSEQRQAMIENFENLIEDAEGVTDNNPPGSPGSPLVQDPEVSLIEIPSADATQSSSLPPSGGESERPKPASATILPPSSPDELVIGKKVTNPNLPGNTIVVEPSVSNMALSVFYLSNDRADYSSDGGKTFSTLNIPGGPPAAPNFCCDQTIVFDPSRSIWIWSRLYINSASNTGITQISVIKNPPKIGCTYNYNPSDSTNTYKVDYPQLGLSDNKVYLSTSEFVGKKWVRARMLRMDLDDIAACPPSVTARVAGYKPSTKRMWTPIRGAKRVMYWANPEDNTHLRIWTWPEDDPNPTWVVKKVQPTANSNPDCRGGNNNQDWMEKKGWHLGEGILRGALARGGTQWKCPDCDRLQFFWNSNKDSTHLQAYVRSAVFDLPDLNVVAEPNIHRPDMCFGYADVHPNARGDLGVTVAFGGRDGGNGRALGAGVAIEDEYTKGFHINKVYVTSSGTDMPSSKNKSWDQRYGDYLSVKPDEPCSLWWIAGNYALRGGGGPKNVVGHYLEFGRYRDRNCWERWNETVPESLP